MDYLRSMKSEASIWSMTDVYRSFYATENSINRNPDIKLRNYADRVVSICSSPKLRKYLHSDYANYAVIIHLARDYKEPWVDNVLEQAGLYPPTALVKLIQKYRKETYGYKPQTDHKRLGQ